jgi:hypothetical protein
MFGGLQLEPFAVEHFPARGLEHLERRLVRELDADALHQLVKSLIGVFVGEVVDLADDFKLFFREFNSRRNSEFGLHGPEFSNGEF